MELELSYMIQISLKFILKDQIYDKSSLALVIT